MAVREYFSSDYREGRRKFRDADPGRSYMENVWGVGYRLLGFHP